MSKTDDGKWKCDHPGCTAPLFDTPQSYGGHVGNAHKDSSDEPVVPTEDGRSSTDDTDGVAKPPPGDSEYIPPKPNPTPHVLKPKVADGLIPWLSMVGFAVHRRNAYDGTVISNGIPAFTDALDEVAQQNEALYKLLAGIKLGDSPNFRLALASLAIIVPILANHRPDSNGLRNITGALRMMPGTKIPRLPPRAENTEGDTAADDMADKVQAMVENLPPEQAQAMADAFDNMPQEMKDKLLEQSAVMFGGAAHPEVVHDAPED